MNRTVIIVYKKKGVIIYGTRRNIDMDGLMFDTERLAFCGTRWAMNFRIDMTEVLIDFRGKNPTAIRNITSSKIWTGV